MYEFTGTVVADPKTQTATCVFTSAKTIPTALESFTMTKEVHNELSEFCFKGDAQSTMLHLVEYYKSIASNVTHIYDRFDLHLSCDLVFHSPLSFVFDGEPVKKGWADVVIIGDTRCGKNYVAVDGFMNYYGVGEKLSSDNATLTGLIGGLQRVNNDWTVKWGAFPRNDAGLLIVDELIKLPSKVLSHLDSIRSEGVAEINKIQSYSTPARTRLLILTNPPKKPISQYTHGIMALMDVMKAPQNVSRSDYALVVSRNEATDDVNSVRQSLPIMHSRESEKKLINWIWSRKPNEIVFSEKATEKVYLLSIDLANSYSFDIPLIQAENVRYKLAKIAICFAGRLYSNKYKGRQLFVDTVHVELAWMFLTMIYKKPASSYLQYSKIKKSFEAATMKDGIEAIKVYFNAFPTKRILIMQSLLMNESITHSDIKGQADLPADIALEIISKLVKWKLVERRGFSYIKTSRFSEFLRDEILKN
jgi:hypothetical protein